MYVTAQMIGEMTARFGNPASARFAVPVAEAEYERIKSSQKQGRRHDATLYIIKDDRIVAIAKHFYPPGLYRAPSGGLEPGETLEAGIMREAFEETGCEIALEHFLLVADVAFQVTSATPPKTIDWTSLVFQARYISGDFKFTDTREIREVRLAALRDFEGFSKIMRQSESGGLHYRAALHDAVKGLLRF